MDNDPEATKYTAQPVNVALELAQVRDISTSKFIHERMESEPDVMKKLKYRRQMRESIDLLIESIKLLSENIKQLINAKT